MKKLWLLLPALILAAGLVFMGCDEPKDDGPVPTGDATWEVTQNGVEGLLGFGIETTKLTITFNKDVTLQSQNVSFPTTIVTRGNFTKVSDKVYEIGVTTLNSGTLSVTITRNGIEPGPKTVAVWKPGTVVLKNFTAVADGAANETTSTKITITLASALAALDAEQFTLTKPTTGGADVIKGDLTSADEGVGLVYDLAISVVNAGNILIATTIEGYDTAPVTVAVYKAPDIVEGIEVPEIDTSNAGYNKWDISAEDLAAIKEAVDGSKLRLTFTVPSDKHDYGIGAIGVAEGATLELKVPIDQTGLTVTIEVWVAWVLEKLGDGDTLSVMVWKNQGAELTGIAIIEPETPFTPPESPKPPAKPAQVAMPFFIFMQEIITTSGNSADLATGKGNIEGDDLAAIKAAPAGSILRFYIKSLTGADRNNWGIGNFGPVNNVQGKPFYDNVNHLFLVDLQVSQITGLADATYLFINIWGECAVALCELWKPDETVTQPEKTVTLLSNTDGGNYQALETGLFGGRKILVGDEYTLAITFTSDKDIDELTIFLVDNSQAAGWWKVLSNEATIEDIVAGEEKTATVKLTATLAAANATNDANKLAFAADGDAIIRLDCWSWSFTRTADGEEEEVVPPEPGANDKVGFTLVKGISTTGGSSADPETGKGNIEGEDIAAVIAARPWSVLRFYYGEGTGNYGIGTVGSVQLLGTKGYYDVWVDDLALTDASTYVFVNIWGGSITKCELWSPPEGTSYTKTQELSITPPAEPGNGKGNIEGEDFTKFNAAAPGSFVRIIWTGTNGTAGGIGNITGDIELIDNSNGYLDVDVAAIKKTISAGGTNFFINAWGTATLAAAVELWEPSVE